MNTFELAVSAATLLLVVLCNVCTAAAAVPNETKTEQPKIVYKQRLFIPNWLNYDPRTGVFTKDNRMNDGFQYPDGSSMFFTGHRNLKTPAAAHVATAVDAPAEDAPDCKPCQGTEPKRNSPGLPTTAAF